jgi:hypothetical protein
MMMTTTMMMMMMMMMMILPNPGVQKFFLKHQQFMFLPQHTGPSLVAHIKVQIMKIYITAGCFQFILKEHNISETHPFRPQVKRFGEAFIQLGSLEMAIRFLQKLRIYLPNGPNRINASLPLTLLVPVSETLVSSDISDSGQSPENSVIRSAIYSYLRLNPLELTYGTLVKQLPPLGPNCDLGLLSLPQPTLFPQSKNNQQTKSNRADFLRSQQSRLFHFLSCISIRD